MPSFRYIILLALVPALGVTFLLGCNPAKIRRFTYPPDFKYIEHSAVESAMLKLARHVRSLDRILREPAPYSTDQQTQVVNILRAMEATAAELDPGGQRSNHPLIDRNIGAFRRDIELARRAAEHDPPNYFLAGTVSGACRSCHQEQP
ncbi:MAG: hypothetical protein HY207_02195 [Nitrospirae bacterium]|nr:hypothetical protein [Nitrospirota bacterium]